MRENVLKTALLSGIVCAYKGLKRKSMTKSLFILIILVFGSLLFFTGDSPSPDIFVVYPTNSDSVSYDQGKIVLVSALAQTVPNLVVASQWETEQVVPIGVKAEKENFPKEFYKLVSKKRTIQSLVYMFRFFKGYSAPETLKFSYFDTMSVKSLWQKPSFSELVKTIQTNNATEIILTVRGWQDSVYTPVYDDPSSEGRTLYKTFVKLLPGNNEIYFSSPDNLGKAVSYVTSFRSESVPVADRTAHFHNSTLEQSCTTCHEGLPSSDSGATMTADCNVCHKEAISGAHLHSPVESKDCSSCHSWSVEKKSVVLENGVPETCFACHDDKKNVIDTAAVQHPVVSECATCHSPHGTELVRMLKKPVYQLCTSCHEEQKINHPVGRHPLRFAKSPDGTEEISCITCHMPHGSQNQKLLKVGGNDTTQICGACH